MIHAEALDLVKWKQHTSQEQLVLLLQREREAVDNGTQDFQQLGNAIEALRFVCELEEDIVDRSPNIRPEIQELAVNAVQRCFEEIALPRVLRIKQFQKLGNSMSTRL